MVKMHKNEINIDETLIRRLLNLQFPQYAGLSIKPVPSAGTDNAIFRLGKDLCIRLPRIPQDFDDMEDQNKCLAKFTPLLPISIPHLVDKGSPNSDYPWNWYIFNWIEGENAVVRQISDLQQAAVDLAQFLLALQGISTEGGFPSSRSMPLVNDDETRLAIENLKGIFDIKKINTIWKECLNAPNWERPPVWTHGDLLPTNLIVNHDRITAVIDFDMSGIGDPACDLLPAWSILSTESRKTFRDRLGVDDATWMRGCGRALSIACIIIPYYKNTNPTLVSVAKRILKEIIESF